VIGGIGSGSLHFSGLDTMKWFPDRRGLATGLRSWDLARRDDRRASSGRLMRHFATAEIGWVWQTFVALAAIYLCSWCVAHSAIECRATDGRRPLTPPVAAAKSMVTHRHVHLDTAWKTPQFWLLWAVRP